MQSNEMKLYVGLLALTNVLRARVQTGNAENKKELLFFLAALFWVQVFCGTEGRMTDWNSPAKQSNRKE